MKRRMMSAFAGCGLTVLAFAGCATPEGASPPADSSGSTSSPAAPSDVDVTTADSGLGEIIVDANGMTAYVFDNDVPDSGESSCSGQCLQMWPPITAASDMPAAEGITATVDTITGPDGDQQITINGLPIYTFVNDEASGDTKGQGVNDLWWALTPAGEKIAAAGGGY